MATPEAFLSNGTTFLGQGDPLEPFFDTADVTGVLSQFRAAVGRGAYRSGAEISMTGTEIGSNVGKDANNQVQTDQTLSLNEPDSQNVGEASSFFRQPVVPEFTVANYPRYEVEATDTDSVTGMAKKAQLVGTSSASAQGGELQVILPAPDQNFLKNRIVFSTVNEEIRAAKELTLRNTGTGPLTITGLSFGNGEPKAKADFELINPPSQPFTLNAGASRTLAIRFAPKGGDRVASLNSNDSPTHTKNGEQYDSLKISTNDPDRPTVTVKLAGLNSANYEGENEPSLAEIVRTFGYRFDVGTEDNILGGSKTPIGADIYSPYWERADATKSVQLWPLAVYAGRRDDPHVSVKFVAKPGSGGKSGQLYLIGGRANDDSPDTLPNPPYEGQAVPGSNKTSGGENQKLLPKILVDVDGSPTNSTPTASTVNFTPTSAFALVSNSAWTDDSKNGSEKLHDWRIYPLGGNAKTATNWVAAVDPGNNSDPRTGKNFDYNDQVYLLVNARPES